MNQDEIITWANEWIDTASEVAKEELRSDPQYLRRTRERNLSKRELERRLTIAMRVGVILALRLAEKELEFDEATGVGVSLA